MAVLILLLCDSWQVVYGEALLDQLHTYDVLHYDVRVEPGAGGCAIDCGLRLRVERPGPLRFLLSADARGLTVERDGARVKASLAEGGYAKVLRFVARRREGVPLLLTVEPDPPPRAGEELTLRLRYLWRPGGTGLGYAEGAAMQTHLSSFWLPVMADEFFEATLRVRVDGTAVGSGDRADGPEGWKSFRSARPLQTVCLVTGDFRVLRRERAGRWLELYLPRGAKVESEAVLDDLAAVLDLLEGWFGPALGLGFRLVVEPRERPSPSYCAGSFAVIHRDRLPDRSSRKRWLAHLAHECSHVWWGHKVASPVVGGGGTWLREGLAQWSGVKVAGALLGEEVERELFRACVRGYFHRIDLRRPAREPEVIFANEPTLSNASYLDEAAVAYLRGALVHRILEHHLGTEAFLTALREFVRKGAYRFVRAADYASALGAGPLVDYYVRTSRLPDFAIANVRTTDGGVELSVRCSDPDLPELGLPCRLQTTAGSQWAAVRLRAGVGILRWSGEGVPVRVEIDPERVHLDPVRSNNVWPEPR
ncbi:MAG: M1 family aminopeptidase [Planctomycetota bacterium]|jgi:hypothetical protein